MRVDFYQLSDKPVEKVVVELAGKIVESGERLLIVAKDTALLDILDERLWSDDPSSFLPHAKVGEGSNKVQPILLSDAIVPANDAGFFMIADGHWRDEALVANRVFYLFDNATIDEARGAWRALADKDDVETNYWKRANGRWVEGP